ncbi:MAG: prevent-host-death family protein [Actinomycetaceae bacterium]|nr:prevent-host-death family protein [Actinomycetaceae bacterium]
MVSSFFSRPKSHDSDRSRKGRSVESSPNNGREVDAERTEATSEQEAPQARAHVEDVMPSKRDVDMLMATSKWSKQMEELTKEFTRDQNRPSLDLTYAHPGGMAQLFALRTTPISLLIREPGEAERARSSVRALMDRAREVMVAHGSAPIHMAFGHASWRGEDGPQSSPMLLSPVEVKLDSAGEASVRMSGVLSIAPGIIDAAHSAGVELDTQAIIDASRQSHGFSAAPSITRLRNALSGVLPAFDSDERMEMSLFVHPANDLRGELENTEMLLQSTFVRALAGDEEAAAKIKKELLEPNPEDRDPWSERGFGDQLPETLDLVEAVVSGSNLMFDTSGGADLTSILASVAVDAAANGRRVLVVGSDRHESDSFWNYLNASGLSHAVARVDGTNNPDMNLVMELARVFQDEAPFVDRESIELMRTQLRRVRESLSKHTEELHRPVPEWGVSAYDALQVLTDLTSMRPGPRTKVRFSADSLTNLAHDSEDQAKTALRSAAEQGMFSRGGKQDAWFGAVISSPEQVGPVLEVVGRLASELPKLRVSMSATAGQTGLNPATTFKEWEEQLVMLEGVREALDVFQPSIFERPIADMVIATASNQWRRDHGYPMKRRQRKHLVKSAKDMLRPGRYVEDLNEELRKVQRQREIWRAHQATDGWPKVPTNLEEMKQHAGAVKEDLKRLDTHLATAHGPLQRMDIGELSLLFDRLNADPNGARALPERLETMKVLHKFGLDALVKDLRERKVPNSLVEKELDLAWWASALGVMLTRVPSLGGFDPANLQSLIVELQRLDREQVDSLAAVASDKIRRNRVDQMARYFEEEAQLRTALGAGKLRPEMAVKLYSSSPLTRAIFPILMTVPVMVPQLLPLARTIDLLILENVNHLPLSELIPLIARARQIVVTADKSNPTQTVVALENVTVTAKIDPEPVRVNEYVGRLFNQYRIAHSGVPVPVPRAGSKLTISYVDGRGMPAPEKAAVESSSQEVEAVTEMVIEHALVQPERSLAVLTLNEIHAERLRENLKRTAANSPALESFFRQERPDPFVIVSLESNTNLRRDRAILSVGFAKTPHGRVLHDFGKISQAEGIHDLARVLGCAGEELNIVSSVHPGQFDRGRFSAEGPKLLLDLMLTAEEASGISGVFDEEAEAPETGEAAAAGVEGGEENSAPAKTAGEGVNWPTFEAKPDQLLIDLADRLYSVGLTVIPNLGVEGSLRVPLAIGHPNFPDELLVAILTDDETYVSERSLRRRDRYWPELLEANGWKTRTELAMAVFIDPQKEADAIIDMVLDAVDERTLALQATEANAAEEFEESELDAPAEGAPVEGEELAGEESGPTLEEGEELIGMETAAQRMVRIQADEDIHGTAAQETIWQPAGAERSRRPEIAVGLPLAAYSDDQLDEIVQWIISDGVERTEDQLVEETQNTLGLTRRGAQVDAVLRNVVRRIGH